ncbi:MAG: DUF1573 domain-containing protein [Bacteroidetes bacterium]|nr:DUF1573 domain-containing protein [Bacteroidota bacterium]
MRSITLIPVFAFLVLASCSAGSRKPDTDDIEKNKTSIENPVLKPNGPKGEPVFTDTVFNFGKVRDGESVQHKFTFKNTGKGDLVISEVKASCGCTTNDWTRDIIKPGGEGFILATFNSSGKGAPEGILAEKTVTAIFSNSNTESVELKFRAMVYSEPEKK